MHSSFIIWEILVYGIRLAPSFLNGSWIPGYVLSSCSLISFSCHGHALFGCLRIVVVDTLTGECHPSFLHFTCVYVLWRRRSFGTKNTSSIHHIWNKRTHSLRYTISPCTTGWKELACNRKWYIRKDLTVEINFGLLFFSVVYGWYS
jgi:hypothetical protein